MTLLTAALIVFAIAFSVGYLIVVFDGWLERRDARRRNPR
jgi:hypothetical protein